MAAEIRSTLTVYYDGQFWVALVEQENDGVLEVARHVFGPEPSLPEIEALVNGPGWSRLHFMPAGSIDTRDATLPANPKRRQREAARQARAHAPSTKSQEALQAALEARRQESTTSGRERRSAKADQRWEQRVATRKEKRRGR
ncbi:MAG: YjdF family protein [Thermoleophilia bacterium]|nr:YjdF family protein [Thermoleophilia bacterium]